MRHQQETVATDDWDGEFGSYDEWARLGPQPPYRSATFVLMLKVEPAAAGARWRDLERHLVDGQRLQAAP
jgi:hypothetical protein